MEAKPKNHLFKSVLIVIAVGIWALVLQNAGVIPTNQNVKVVNEIDANVRGSVDADISNTVDVNIGSVNGHSNAFYGPSNNGNYDAIHVYTGK